MQLDPIVLDRYRKHRQLLFHHEDVVEIVRLLEGLSRREVILWSLSCAFVTMKSDKELEECRKCLEMAVLWSQGKLKMPEVKKEILRLHRLAKTITNKPLSLRFHAIAQACSSVHTPKHAIGLVLYELSSIIYELGPDRSLPMLETTLERYVALSKTVDENSQEWAAFLQEKNNS